MSAVLSLLLLLGAASAAEPAVYFQAHRGAADEAPENTLPALRLAYGVPGAVPEVDLRTTADGHIVAIHDATPARTTDAPAPWTDRDIAEIPLATLREWDAGAWFEASFAGAKVPTLDEVFAIVREDDAREIYLDLKAVDEGQIRDAILAVDLGPRVIFVHPDWDTCERLMNLYPGARTMTWISGPPRHQERRFARLLKREARGLSQLQFHLPLASAGPPPRYPLSLAYLAEARQALAAYGVALQVRHEPFTPETLKPLLDLGIEWYVTDAPQAFHEAVVAAHALGE